MCCLLLRRAVLVDDLKWMDCMLQILGCNHLTVLHLAHKCCKIACWLFSATRCWIPKPQNGPPLTSSQISLLHFKWIMSNHFWLQHVTQFSRPRKFKKCKMEIQDFVFRSGSFGWYEYQHYKKEKLSALSWPNMRQKVVFISNNSHFFNM